MCDAILVTSSQLGEEEAMKANAKAALKQAINEEFHVKVTTKGKTVVGNRRGLHLAEDLSELKETVASQKESHQQ